MGAPEYLHLRPGCVPPDLRSDPFCAVVVIEAPVTAEWRAFVSAWLVQGGCLYMMACGSDCSLWDDSVDDAMLEAFDYGDVPDDRFVMTTWHEKEPLGDVFWFCENNVRHSALDLKRAILVHISPVERKLELLHGYESACRT